jgi:hypothetical protein
VHGLIADGPGGAWTFGSSILTFAFPMILFIVVAGALYVLYTKPESTPGHRGPRLERPVTYTAVPGIPLGHPAQAVAVGHLASARPAAAGTTASVPTEVPVSTEVAGPTDVAGPAGEAHTPVAETPAAETTTGEAAETDEDAE